jgi:hypothetical protein
MRYRELLALGAGVTGVSDSAAHRPNENGPEIFTALCF